MADVTTRMRPGGDIEFSVAFGAAETSKTIQIDPAFNDGQRYPYIYRGFLVIPNWTNAVTLAAAFTITSNSSTITLDNQHSALARNGTREMPNLTVENSRSVTLTCTLSGVPGGSGGTLKGILFSKLVGGAPNASDGVVDSDVNVAEFGGVAVQLDDTDKPAVSIYGAASAAGDQELSVESGGEVKTSLYAYNAAAADTAVTCEATGELDANVAMIAGVAPQIDDTDKLGVSLYAKSSAAGDKEVLADSDGHLQVDVLSTTGTSDVNVAQIAGTATAAGAGAVDAGTQRTTLASDDPAVVALQIMDDWDETDRAKVNPIVGQAGIAAGAGAVGATVPRVTLASDDPGVALLGTIDADTSSLAGCVGGTELQVDLVGNAVNVSQFGGVNVQLDDTDKPAISLYGKNSAAGDTAIGVTSNERVKIQKIPIGTTNATVDLPANSSNPQEIDCSGAGVHELHVYVAEEWRWCVAADQATANTNIASDASSVILPAGYWAFCCSESSNKFYARSNDASALTDGLRYWFGEV